MWWVWCRRRRHIDQLLLFRHPRLDLGSINTNYISNETHSGFMDSTSSIFHSLFQLFICFSLFIADTIFSCCSYQTKFVTLYCFVNPSYILFLCWDTLAVRLLVTPVYSVPYRLFANIYIQSPVFLPYAFI